MGIFIVEYFSSQSNLGTFIEGRKTTFLLYMTVKCTKIEVAKFGMILKDFMC
jgi:hypothetical protein